MALGVALGADIAGPRRSASICGRLIVSCRSSRLGSFARASPLRGRPRLRRRFGFAAFGAGFSRASIAVASREMCSTRWPSIVRAISAHADGWPDGSRRVRENVASLGSRPPPLQPHSRQPAVNLKTLDQGASSERRTRPWLGARQRRAVLLRTPYLGGSREAVSQPAPVPEPRRRARSARPSGRARPPASGTTLVERRTSNPIASRAGTRLHSSVGIMRCFATAHDTHEGGPSHRKGLHSGRKPRPAVLQEAPYGMISKTVLAIASLPPDLQCSYSDEPTGGSDGQPRRSDGSGRHPDRRLRP